MKEEQHQHQQQMLEAQLAGAHPHEGPVVLAGPLVESIAASAHGGSSRVDEAESAGAGRDSDEFSGSGRAGEEEEDEEGEEGEEEDEDEGEGDSEGKFACKYCSKKFRKTVHLVHHERVHTGEKPFTCKFCKKCFRRNCDLIRHERLHTGDQLHSCKYCEKRFNSASDVTRHERTHTGEKPFRCCYCDRPFSDKSALTRHKRTHTGEQPYKCTFCSKCFSTSGNLARHLRTRSHWREAVIGELAASKAQPQPQLMPQQLPSSNTITLQQPGSPGEKQLKGPFALTASPSVTTMPMGTNVSHAGMHGMPIVNMTPWANQPGLLSAIPVTMAAAAAAAAAASNANPHAMRLFPFSPQGVMSNQVLPPSWSRPGYVYINPQGNQMMSQMPPQGFVSSSGHSL